MKKLSEFTRLFPFSARGFGVTCSFVSMLVAAPVFALGNLVPGGPDRYAEARIGVGEFRSHCTFSHRATHDPIVAPGNPNFMHSHDFFGNTSTNFMSTTESLSAHYGTSCDPAFPPTTGVGNGPAEDTAAYWIPSLVHKDTGKFIDPTRFIAYYFVKKLSDPLQLHNIPHGLRMVAGNAHASVMQGADVATWNCIGDAPQYPEIPECGNKTLQMLLYFPECWDGVNLDSASHQSHVAYRGADGCPASHPVLIPKLELQIQYENRPAGELLVDSDRMMNTSKGRTAHGDFINTWFQPALDFRTERCLMWPVTCFTEGQDVRIAQNRWPTDLNPPFDPTAPSPTRNTQTSYAAKSSVQTFSSISSSRPAVVSSRSSSASSKTNTNPVPGSPVLELSWPTPDVTIIQGYLVGFWGKVTDVDTPVMTLKISATIKHLASGQYLLADGSWAATPGPVAQQHQGSVVAGDGHWRVMHTPPTRSGSYELVVTATDSAGNTSVKTTSYRVQ